MLNNKESIFSIMLKFLTLFQLDMNVKLNLLHGKLEYIIIHSISNKCNRFAESLESWG